MNNPIPTATFISSAYEIVDHCGHSDFGEAIELVENLLGVIFSPEEIELLQAEFNKEFQANS